MTNPFCRKNCVVQLYPMFETQFQSGMPLAEPETHLQISTDEAGF
jgi:hypothetical protein